MKTSNVFLVLIVLIVVGTAAWFLGAKSAEAPTPPVVTSFETCAEAKYPVTESAPRTCKTPDGRTYAEELPEKITYVKASADVVVVDLPYPGAVTGKEFSVVGKARAWYFEGSFPIEVLDKNGARLAVSYVQAQGDWMTSEWVPFKGEIKVPHTYSGPATLVLHKDNPSGLPEHDASMSFPITIAY